MRRHLRAVSLEMPAVLPASGHRIQAPAAKRAVEIAASLALAVLLVLVGFGLARRALAPDTCCGPSASAEAR